MAFHPAQDRQFGGWTVDLIGEGRTAEGSWSAHECGGAQADGLELANDPVELAHVVIPFLQSIRLFRAQPDGDGLASNLSSPLAIRAVQHRGIGFAATRWVSAAVEGVRDASAEHQSEIRELGHQGAMSLFEALERRVDRLGTISWFLC